MVRMGGALIRICTSPHRHWPVAGNFSWVMKGLARKRWMRRFKHVHALAAMLAWLVCSVSVTVAAEPGATGVRRIEIDVSRASRAVDRFFDFSIGSDYPGTLLRPDSQAHLKLAVDELG